MSTVKKAGVYYKTVDGDTMDYIAFRNFGITSGIVEKLYQENPGVAKYGPTFPAGVIIFIPEDVVNSVNEQDEFLDIYF